MKIPRKTLKELSKIAKIKNFTALSVISAIFAVIIALLSDFGYLGENFSDLNEGEIFGRVERVTDGDTIVITGEFGRAKIRLFGIDAPELAQPFGRQAAAVLGDLILTKNVRVKLGKVDKYGRRLGVVFLNGSDINAQMVSRGLAWAYLSQNYADEMAAAKGQKIGLWSEKNPVKPSDWRQNR